jgi:RHS repeat-associated protein
MLVPNRFESVEDYKYGFQGQEKDDEIKGEGNSLNYTFRMHDPRAGRFLSLDPLISQFPWNSPYSFSENNVIQFIELEGLEKATTEDKRDAFMVINYFEIEQDVETVWNKISKKDFLDALKSMVLSPNSIDQSSTNLCGIAATCKSMIEYDPVNFVKGAISLYKTGSMGSLSIFHFDIEANSDMFNSSPTNGLNPAEYIIMSSMRHSSNISLDYDPKTDNQGQFPGLRGFTYPGDLSEIATNFANMKDVTYNYPQTIEGLNNAFKDEATVIALYDIDHLKTGYPSNVIQERTFGSHYVVINSIESKNGNVTINYWNYGDESKTQTTITVSQKTYDKATKNYTILNSD